MTDHELAHTEIVDNLARIAYEAINAMDVAKGHVTPLWDDLPLQVKMDYHKQVQRVLRMRGAEISMIHDDSVAEMEGEGWVHGYQHNEEAKTSHMITTYDRLPLVDRQRLCVFTAVVRAIYAQ